MPDTCKREDSRWFTLVLDVANTAAMVHSSKLVLLPEGTGFLNQLEKTVTLREASYKSRKVEQSYQHAQQLTYCHT